MEKAGNIGPATTTHGSQVGVDKHDYPGKGVWEHVGAGTAKGGLTRQE